MLALVILCVFLLTLQSPAGTGKLSETVKQWLECIGISCDSHTLRSNAHLAEYFVLGIALTLFCRELGWKNTQVIIAGCGIGLLDECLKILLPTREFSWVDWLKDCTGVLVAVLIVSMIKQRFKKDSI